jgi:hypothetical protein
MELIEHYEAAAFGSPHIDEKTQGARILDLIRSKERGPDALPLSRAADYVITALEGQGDSLALYQSGGTGWARPIPLQRDWKIPKQRAETTDEIQRRVRQQRASTGPNALGFVSRSPRLVTEFEARRRAWLSILRDELVGSRTRRALDSRLLIALVIPRSLADALFGFGTVPAAVAKPIVVVGTKCQSGTLNEPSNVSALGGERRPGDLPLMAVVPQQAEKRTGAEREKRESFARNNFKPTKDSNAVWRSDDFRELLRQVEEMTKPGAGKLKAAEAHDLIGKIWGLSRNSVKTYCTKARDSENKQPAARRA